jgi:hypothetical protein
MVDRTGLEILDLPRTRHVTVRSRRITFGFVISRLPSLFQTLQDCPGFVREHVPTRPKQTQSRISKQPGFFRSRWVFLVPVAPFGRMAFGRSTVRLRSAPLCNPSTWPGGLAALESQPISSASRARSSGRTARGPLAWRLHPGWGINVARGSGRGLGIAYTLRLLTAATEYLGYQVEPAPAPVLCTSASMRYGRPSRVFSIAL